MLEYLALPQLCRIGDILKPLGFLELSTMLDAREIELVAPHLLGVPFNAVQTILDGNELLQKSATGRYCTT